MFLLVWRHHARSTTALLATLLLFLAQNTHAQTNEFRGLWVDAFNSGFKTSTQVSQLLADARTGNFNAVIVQMRRRGDAFYNSNFEPKNSEVSPTGFDPLADLITKAHDTSGGKQRIEVHAWIVSFPIWNSTNSTPASASHPFNLHPDWLTQESNSNKWDGSNFFLDPGHQEVQRHTFNVAMDIISRYDVDGLNFDYIRYSGKTWGYNPVSVARFNQRFGRTGLPANSDAQWMQFRRDQVSGLVRKVYLHAAAIKPQVKISADTICFAPGVTTAAQWTNSAAAYTDKLQDWRSWMEEGIIDLNIPMMYFDHLAYGSAWTNWSTFVKSQKFNRHAALGPGIYLNTVSNTFHQVRTARLPAPSTTNLANGVSFYAYSLSNDEGVSRANFLAALTQTNSALLYDTSGSGPVFAAKATIPAMPWKTAPTRGHLKGFTFQAGTSNGLDFASVTITGPTNRTLRTDATGFYGAVDLPPGSYVLTASFPGYQTVQSTNTITAGTVTTVDFRLPIPVAPAIVTQPQSLTAVLGSNATFTVSANGSAPLFYQWLFNGGAISGATNTSLTVTNATLDSAGAYTVLVTNLSGSDLSDAATLTVSTTDAPPVLTTYPQSKTAFAGSSITLTATGTGTAPLSYLWRKDGVPIPGATNSTLTLTNLAATNTGNYTVSLSNNAGSDTSPPAALAVVHSLNLSINGSGSVSKSPDLAAYLPGTVVTLTPSAFFAGWSGAVGGTTSPLVLTITSNTTLVANFGNEIIVDDEQATVAGSWTASAASPGFQGIGYRFRSGGSGANYVQFTPTIPYSGSYQVFAWYVQGANRTTNAPYVISFSGGSQTNFINQKSGGSQWVSLGTFNFAAGNSGYVRVTDQFPDAAQVVMADAIRFVATSLPTQPPSLLAQPSGDTVIAGQSATFSVVASGAAPLFYQWRLGGTPIVGATNATLVRTNLQTSEAGNYSVIVSNSAGTVTSSNAVLTVIAPALVLAGPTNASATAGTNIAFAVTATGTASLRFQWRHNGVPLPGETNATLNLSSVTLDDEGTYMVSVANAAGAMTSPAATLTVLVPPQITLQPVSRSIDPGSPATFNVLVGGTVPFTYDWRRNGTSLGINNATLTLQNVQPAQAGAYTVVISNSAGSTESDPADLLVLPQPMIDSVQLVAGPGLALTWSTIPGRSYRVEATSALGSGVWSVVSPTLIASQDALSTTLALDSTNRFLRVVRLPISLP